MFETSTIFASLIWGGIGSGFLIYGIRQRAVLQLLGGAALVGASYFTASALYMSLFSIAVLAVMIFLIRRG